VSAAFAALPLAVVLIAMGWAHLSAARAGAIGLIVALAWWSSSSPRIRAARS
jgi:L-lactate permease